MTDDELNKDTEQMDTESAFAGDEEGQEESWQHEAPPEDDFHDPDAFHEELTEESLSQEDFAEDMLAQGEGDVEPAVDRGRGKVVFYGLLGVIALVAGGLAYLQLGGTGGENTFAPLVQEQGAPMVQTVDGAAPGGAQETQNDKAEAAGVDSMSSLYAPSQAGAPGDSAGEQPKLETSSEIMTLDPVRDDAAAPVVVPAEQEAVAAPTIKSVETIEVSPAQLSKSVDALVPMDKAAAPASAEKPVSAEVEKRLDNMSAKIEALQSALDQTAQKNAELLDKLNALRAEAGREPDTSDIEARLSRLEHEEKKQPSYVSPKAKEAVDQKPVQKAIAKSKKPVAKAKKEIKPAAKVKPAEPSVVLRAATPDAAWIAKDAESTELKRVTVGDEVSGIGKIKDIRQDGDQWVIVGSKGTLR